MVVFTSPALIRHVVHLKTLVVAVIAVLECLLAVLSLLLLLLSFPLGYVTLGLDFGLSVFFERGGAMRMTSSAARTRQWFAATLLTFPHATVAVVAAHLQVIFQVVNAQVAASSAALLLLLPLLVCLVLIVLSAILLPEAFLQHNAEMIHHLVPPVKRRVQPGWDFFCRTQTHMGLLPAPLLFSLLCSEGPVLCQRCKVVPAMDGKGLKSTVRTLREDVVGSIFCNATLLLTFEPEKIITDNKKFNVCLYQKQDERRTALSISIATFCQPCR